MQTGVTRRRVLAGSGAAVAMTGLPLPGLAEDRPVKIGLLTVKTGPLAQGGIQMEQGTTLFLKHSGNKLAGRAVELIVADTGGTPAGTKTKAQELIERDRVDMIFGPLAAFELLAISDYTAEQKCPILSLAAAEDMTQRKPNPYFIRSASSSAQPLHPLADYARKHLKYETVITVANDFAYGYEQIGGFQRVFEDEGGRVKDKLWPPLVTPDYTPFLAKMGGVDAIVSGIGGSNPIRFMKQYKDQGITLPLLGGGVAMDDGLLKSFGDGLYRRSADTKQPALCRRQPPRLRRHPRVVRRRPLQQWIGGGSGAGKDRRPHRRQGSLDQGNARGLVDRLSARALPFRPVRQCGRRHLHPAL